MLEALGFQRKPAIMRTNDLKTCQGTVPLTELRGDFHLESVVYRVPTMRMPDTAVPGVGHTAAKDTDTGPWERQTLHKRLHT